MDAQTRHELKQNELQQMLSGFSFFKTETGRKLTLLVVAVVVIFVGYRVWSWNSNQAADESWQALLEAGVPDALDGSAALDVLREIAGSAGDANLRSWAELRLGCGLLRQANFDPTKRDEYAAEAVGVLKQLADASNTPASIAAAAEFGLANGYELQREFDKAKSTYQSIADTERYAGSPYQELATRRIETVDELDAMVTFTPGDAPIPVPPPLASQPAVDATSQPASDATSQPASDATSQPATDATSQPASDATSQPATSTAPDERGDGESQPVASQPADGEKKQP